MEHTLALSKRKLEPLHPFSLHYFQILLQHSFFACNYPTIVESFSNGFILGIPPIKECFLPDNHASLQDLYHEFVPLINKEFLLKRYLGPFTYEQLFNLIGPFQTSPLSLVPKPGTSKFRLIQNLSYPYLSSPVPSINSAIESSNYPCSFGTFLTVCLIINSLPEHSQACTRDVQDAYRTIPVHPSQWAGLVIRLASNSFALNTQNSFGLASAGGVWGYVADFLADTFRFQGIGPVTKWVDDFLFFRVPSCHVPRVNQYHTQLQPTLIKR